MEWQRPPEPEPEATGHRRAYASLARVLLALVAVVAVWRAAHNGPERVFAMSEVPSLGSPLVYGDDVVWCAQSTDGFQFHARSLSTGRERVIGRDTTLSLDPYRPSLSLSVAGGWLYYVGVEYREPIVTVPGPSWSSGPVVMSGSTEPVSPALVRRALRRIRLEGGPPEQLLEGLLRRPVILGDTLFWVDPHPGHLHYAWDGFADDARKSRIMARDLVGGSTRVVASGVSALTSLRPCGEAVCWRDGDGGRIRGEGLWWIRPGDRAPHYAATCRARDYYGAAIVGDVCFWVAPRPVADVPDSPQGQGLIWEAGKGNVLMVTSLADGTTRTVDSPAADAGGYGWTDVAAYRGLAYARFGGKLWRLTADSSPDAASIVHVPLGAASVGFEGGCYYCLAPEGGIGRLLSLPSADRSQPQTRALYRFHLPD